MTTWCLDMSPYRFVERCVSSCWVPEKRRDEEREVENEKERERERKKGLRDVYGSRQRGSIATVSIRK